jgi:CSLREA domain-containing protein
MLIGKAAMPATALVLILTLITSGTVVRAATTITVNDTGDPNSNSEGCTLRDAINIANSQSPATDDVCAPSGSGSPYTIEFSVTGMVTLASELPNLDTNLTINGPVASPGITIDGANQTSIMFIGLAVVNLNNLTIAHGNGAGGGVYNGGTLTVTNSTFYGNSAGAVAVGGAIYNGGTLTVLNSTFWDNSAGSTGFGGAIYNLATLTVSNSTFSGHSPDSIGRASTTGTLSGTILAGKSTNGNCDGSSITDGG